ncbi:MAG: 50S ribosomal protein L9 [Gemmatimonadetes bacterium]|nr:50S ribosomal protein L9 [Gemmatimonadota bacterium]
MKVILREDVRTLGKRGDVVDVAAGYARNSLIPRKLAIQDSEANRRVLKDEDVSYGRKEAKAKAEAELLAKDLVDVSLTIAVKVGEEDRLYGSVTNADVHRLLEEQGIHVDKRKIELDEPIKVLGFFNVPIRLHRDVQVEIKLWVMKESSG